MDVAQGRTGEWCLLVTRAAARKAGVCRRIAQKGGDLTLRDTLGRENMQRPQVALFVPKTAVMDWAKGLQSSSVRYSVDTIHL